MLEPELLTRFNNSMRRDAEYFIEEYSEEIGNMSGRCIDIGTGAGDVTVDFIFPKLKSNSTLLCSDISEGMVNYGKKRYGNNEKLAFMKLDIEAPNLPRDLVGQFDHLTSLYCVHWCYDLRRAFENMYSLLRPGGTAFVTVLSSYSGLDAFVELQATPKYQSYMKDAHRIIPPFQGVETPRQVLKSLLSDIGFQVKICSYRPMTWEFDSTDFLNGFLLAVNPVKMDDMPADLKDEYIRDVRRLFMEREIVFNKNRNNKDEYSVLGRYYTSIVFMKKPLNQ